MAAGFLFPYSTTPITVGCYQGIYVGAGSTGPKNERSTKVSASIAADAKVELFYSIPAPLPSGTCKLRARARASATTGNAKFNPKWVSVAAEEDASSATVIAEGTQTISWGSGDTDQIKVLDVTLDADTVVAGEIIAMVLWFETSNWTLAAISGWNFPVVWV